jgi:hypothetical protein
MSVITIHYIQEDVESPFAFQKQLHAKMKAKRTKNLGQFFEEVLEYLLADEEKELKLGIEKTELNIESIVKGKSCADIKLRINFVKVEEGDDSRLKYLK